MSYEVLEVEKADQTFPMTPQDLTNAMVYASYKHNRQKNHDITVKAWAVVYGYMAYKMEQRYQQEVGKT